MRRRTYICLNCFSSKRYESGYPLVCEKCGSQLLQMGFNFKVPRKGNSREWKKLANQRSPYRVLFDLIQRNIDV